MREHKPERTLIVYGTLAPNKPNHSVVEHIKGTWHKGTVRGKLVNQGWGAQSGYPGFMPASSEEQTEIEVFVLISNELESNWQYLDNFEGEDYIRMLAAYELDTGEKGVGNIYAINQNNH